MVLKKLKESRICSRKVKKWAQRSRAFYKDTQKNK